MNFLKDFFQCLINPDICVFNSHKKIILKYKDTFLGPFWNVVNSIFLITILSFSLLILLGCVKDISLDSNLSPISTYDAYLPEGHNMNQNGLFFIDKNKDTANNNYVSLFGFDNNARIKFNNRLLVKNLIQNSENLN